MYWASPPSQLARQCLLFVNRNFVSKKYPSTCLSRNLPCLVCLVQQNILILYLTAYWPAALFFFFLHSSPHPPPTQY